MKKTILFAVILMCHIFSVSVVLGQDEIGADGLFFLRNSIWSIGPGSPLDLGFYENNVYLCGAGACSPYDDSMILELPGLGFFSATNSQAETGAFETMKGFASPLLGVGLVRDCIHIEIPYSEDYCYSFFIQKFSDDFAPRQ